MYCEIFLVDLVVQNYLAVVRPKLVNVLDSLQNGKFRQFYFYKIILLLDVFS